MDELRCHLRYLHQFDKNVDSIDINKSMQVAYLLQ